MQLLKLSTYILLSICVSFAAGDDDCHQYSQDDCGDYDHCWWDNEYDECVHDYDGDDDGPPDCLSDCDGINDIDGDDPMQVCALLDSVWGIAGSCADDCEDDEDYQELNMIAYMCTGCFDAESTSNTTCVDWFYFLDDHDPCGQCHDDCYDAGGNDEGTCHDACEANECACDDDDPCCQCHDTCGGDDTCHQNCDEGDCAADDGPPECLSECEGIDAIDPEEDASGFCTWLTGTDISSCSSGCDDELLTELDMMSWMCTGCLAEDPDGTMGTCGYWLDFKGDDGDEEGEEGPPECLSECTGIEDVDPEGDPSAFCTWASGLSYFTDCMDGCEADVFAEIASYASTCTACIIANNCDEAELSINEKNLFFGGVHAVTPVDAVGDPRRGGFGIIC